MLNIFCWAWVRRQYIAYYVDVCVLICFLQCQVQTTQYKPNSLTDVGHQERQWLSGTTIYHFIPCIRVDDNQHCIWDLSQLDSNYFGSIVFRLLNYFCLMFYFIQFGLFIFGITSWSLIFQFEPYNYFYLIIYQVVMVTSKREYLHIHHRNRFFFSALATKRPTFIYVQSEVQFRAT